MFNPRSFRFWTDQAGVASAMGFTECVAASDEGDGFFIVHCHAGKGFSDIACGGERIRVAVRAFWIDIDQTHLHGTQWIVELAVALVAFIGQPFSFGSPVHVFLWFPDVFTATGEAEGLETH